MFDEPLANSLTAAKKCHLRTQTSSESCEFFCRYLISQGANVGGVNSEGETPLDIAEEEAMEELLQNEINRQGTFIYNLFVSRQHF